ncbi:MAG: hypothetical protein AB8B69_00140 [Chitinophagales bacterium]
MKTVKISEVEYLQMKKTINSLEQELSLLKDKDFLAKLNIAYNLFSQSIKKKVPSENYAIPSIKRGSGKHLITYIADDFTDPIDDFKEYM